MVISYLSAFCPLVVLKETHVGRSLFFVCQFKIQFLVITSSSIPGPDWGGLVSSGLGAKSKPSRNISSNNPEP